MRHSVVTDLPERLPLVVVGDVMLDEYMRGDVSRISPEAPVPVLESARSERALGGAANVATNLQALGCEVRLVGVIGADPAGSDLRHILEDHGIAPTYLVTDHARPTTHKLRVVANAQHVLRIDREQRQNLAPDTASALLDAVGRALPGARGLVISDYKKGVLVADTLGVIIAMANAHGIPVLVDPKGMDYAVYRGATALTPNLHELHLATGLPVHTAGERAQAARSLLESTGAQGLVVTCGKDGMVLYEQNGDTLVIAAEAREVFDVTGAGDTVIATLAMAHVGGASLAEATRLANTAAGIAVGKLGTATVSRAELRRACDPGRGSGEGKLLPLADARRALHDARTLGKRVVLTNGCFDLLHAGHVQYLQSARAMGELLIIGLNSDASVRNLKGPSRPLVPERERALVLAALACVDIIVLFDEPTPAALVTALQPDILVKGADYEGKEVVGRDTVEQGGGRVELLPLYEGRSTTGLVKTILERYRDAN